MKCVLCGATFDSSAVQDLCDGCGQPMVELLVQVFDKMKQLNANDDPLKVELPGGATVQQLLLYAGRGRDYTAQLETVVRLEGLEAASRLVGTP